MRHAGVPAAYSSAVPLAHGTAVAARWDRLVRTGLVHRGAAAGAGGLDSRGLVLQGGGIAALHYTAMASMRMEAECHYSAPIVSLSVLVAIASSLLSLWLAFVFRGGPISWKLRKVGSALSMGVAIAAMHYTGMAAVTFTVSGRRQPCEYSANFVAGARWNRGGRA